MRFTQRLPVDSWADVPAVGAVYGFCCRDVFAYIGQTGNLRRRVRDHLRSNEHLINEIDNTAEVWWKPCSTIHGRRLWERSAIKRHRPTLNVSDDPLAPRKVSEERWMAWRESIKQHEGQAPQD